MRTRTTGLATAFVLSAIACVGSARAGNCPTVGSPVINRPIADAASGLLLIYRGVADPIQGPGTPADWSFYSGIGPTSWITPLLFRVEGSSFVLVGVGEPRQNTAGGVQTHPFGYEAGSVTLEPGISYTFGFTTRLIEASGNPGGLTSVQYSGPVVPFDGYNLQTDPWDYALVGELSLGQEFGPVPGQIPLNSSGSGGRIYSAQFSVACACPADLAPPSGVLNIFDIQTYIQLYNAQDPAADLAAPFGVFNIFDIQQYISLYNQGCP